MQYFISRLTFRHPKLWLYYHFSVLACIGRLCRPTCPRGYYGEQCSETCTCVADICDDVFGCVSTGKKCIRYVSELNLLCEEKLSLSW